jgi:hypothetical protein
MDSIGHRYVAICGHPHGLVKVVPEKDVPLLEPNLARGITNILAINCQDSAASHVFTGGGGDLFNVLWFQFVGSPGTIEVASNSAISGGSFLETSSEGAMDLTNIFDGQSEMGDLIANGLTGAEGYVNEPTLNGIVGVAYNIQHYEAGYTSAESFFAGTPYLGWEGVVVGDPLAAPYLGAATPVTPTPASSFNRSAGGVQTESSSEGDLDVGFTGHDRKSR